MLGDIDYLLNPVRPRLFLAKPNKQIISLLSEAASVSQNLKLTSVNELSFRVPYELEINNERVPNHNVPLLRERYYVQVKLDQLSEWYMITEVNDLMESDKDYKEVRCLALPNELSDKLIKNYSVESYEARQVLTDVLSGTVWKIGSLDPDFELTYRSFEFGDSTALSAVYAIAETYNAIVVWDTNARTVSFVKPEFHGLNKGLKFSYGKYLKTLGRNSTSNEMVTRLKPFGKDGLTINRINPTGQNYIEDFSFFLYPFERDANKNTVKSSDYMSDSLAHALLDYRELAEQHEGSYGTLIGQQDALESSLAQRKTELHNLQNELASITDIQLAQQFDGVMLFEQFAFGGSGSVTKSFTLNPLYPYAVLVKMSNYAGTSLSINGTAIPLSSDRWTVCRKFDKGTSTVNVTVTGAPSDVFVQVANINQDELSGAVSNDAIVDKYNFDHKQEEIDAKQVEIDSIQAQISGTVAQIDHILDLLSVDRNFTPEQKDELNLFIIEKEFSDDNYIEETDLYEAAKKKFDEWSRPQLSVEMDIVNFLSVIEEQGNWSKLTLGDQVVVEYERIGVKVEAKIIEIDFDYEQSSVKLTVANVRDLASSSTLIEKYIYDSKNTTSIVDDNKSKWTKAIYDASEMSRLFENFWNKVTNDINMASNEYVTIDRKGITDIDPNDPLRFIRITHGAIGLTKSGGLRYETAMTPDGVIAEQVLGKIILGERVVIGDPEGIWMTEGPQTTITDRCGREVMKIGLYENNPDHYGLLMNRFDPVVNCSSDIVNRVIMNEEHGFWVQKRNGSSFDDVAWLDTDGLLNVKKMQIDFMDGTLSNGIVIDSTEGIAVTRSDQMYRSLMSGVKGFAIQRNDGTPGSPAWKDVFWADLTGTVHAYDIRIENSFMTNGGIEGAYLILRDGHGGVMKMYPGEGFWAGAENASDAPAWIKPDGTAIFNKLIVKDKDNKLLIDSEKKTIFMNGFDIVGAAAIHADLIAAKMVTADDGFISDLTAGRLTTLTNAPEGNWSNYLRISGNSAKWITGMAGRGTHAKLPDGRLLYWVNSNRQGQMTTEVTQYPAMYYEMDDKVKMIIDHTGIGDSANPRIIMGLGDGQVIDPAIDDGEENVRSARAFLTKYQGGWKVSYYASNNGNERSVDLSDDGIVVKHSGGYTIEISNNDGIKMTDSTGSYFQMKNGQFNFV